MRDYDAASMASTFTWLETSEYERRQTLDVISLFGLTDTLDDLGIGTVRDAIQEQLFPGITTIQTRAAYFLFVPWVYQLIEWRQTASNRAELRARRIEDRVRRALVAAEPGGAGAIGAVAGQNVQRLPSAVYWGGLRAWGVLAFPGSQDAYHRSLDGFYRRQRIARTRSVGDDVEPPPINWHPYIPPPPPGFPDELAFALRHRDAVYLADRVRESVPGTWLAFLLQNPLATPRTAFPWEHPRAPEAPVGIRTLLNDAKVFSAAHYGASLLYNLLLAEAFERSFTDAGGWVARYRGEFARWADQQAADIADLRSWDRDAFWGTLHKTNPRLPPPTRTFVERWVTELLGATHPATLRDSGSVRRFIEDREKVLKGPRARLQNIEQLTHWGGASGAAPLTFRWPQAQQIISDILDGLADPDA